MCLGEVGCVRDVTDGDSLRVDLGARTATVSGMLLDSIPAVGEWVLVHSGFALGQLTEAEAREALELRRETGRETA